MSACRQLPQPPVIEGCQRWDQRRCSWAPPDRFDPRRYSVMIIPKTLAAQYVEAHHYSGSMPAARLSVGLYEAGRGWLGLPDLVGVAVFSVPAQPRVVSAYATDRATASELEASAGVELGRLVLADHVAANAESWFLARAFRLLREALDGVRCVISYSDPVRREAQDGTVIMPGHVGIIYQAHNGTYMGRGSSRTLHLTPDGRALSPRTLSKIRGGERGAAGAVAQLVAAGCPPMEPGEGGPAYLERALKGLRQIRHPGCHVYGWALDRRVELAAGQPYPSLIV